MVLLKFKNYRPNYVAKYFDVDGCKNLPVNKITLNKRGLSSVWEGNRLLGHVDIHPEVLIRELGWSL